MVANAATRRARLTPVRRAQRGARATISDAVRFRTYDEMIEEKRLHSLMIWSSGLRFRRRLRRLQ